MPGKSIKQLNEVAAVFQCQLADLPGCLHETIPHFHHTRSRYDTLMAAIDSDPLNRAADVKAEIEFATAREGLVNGCLETAAGFLTPKEKELLPMSGNLITFEIGLRFLADYLQGDTYFKTHRKGQNIDCCRKQFKMIESMEEQMDAMQEIVSTES